MCVFERCLDGCKHKPGRLVLPDSLDERALSAAARLKAEGLAEPILIGNPMALRAAAAKAGLSFSDIWCIDPESKDFLERNAAEYKAYGNSVATPCVFFVLAGIVWAMKMEG